MSRPIAAVAAILTLTMATALRLPGSGPARPSVKLTILHTNDTHGHLLPFSYPETYDRGSVLSRLQARRSIGGIARRAGLVNQIRKEPGANVLLLDAGDICDGTPFSTEFRGEADVAAMNSAGYDAACPGNHEFNNTISQMRKLAALARYPTVCANVRSTSDSKLLYAPHVVKRVGPLRVAIFGLTTTDARAYPAARDGLTIDPPVATARSVVEALRSRSDVVIALTHLGVEEDRRLAVEVNGIDAIVGGHSHTYLAAPLFIGLPPGPESSSVNGTIIAHNFEWGAMLGRLNVRLVRGASGRWTVAGYSGSGLPVTAKTPVHSPTQAVVGKYWSPIKGKFGRRIGTAAADFTQLGHDRAEYNLAADALRAKTGAQVAVENIGSIRAPLVRGPITYGDLITMDPFGNTIVTMRVTGAQLLKLLAERRPAVSGVRYRMRQRSLVAASIGADPVDASRKYTLATSSFFARDPLLNDAEDRKDTGALHLDALIEFIRTKGTVRPEYDGRRVIEGIPDD